MKEHGFSLVELILTITIISIVITGSAAILIGSQARGLEAQHEAAATAAADQQIEALRAAPFSSLADGTTNFTPTGVPRVTSATVQIADTEDSDQKQATAQVKWMEGTRLQTVTLTTVINKSGLNRQ